MTTESTNDMATILTRLSGRIEIKNIEFSQMLLSGEYRETGVNDLVFVKKMYGVYFYTSRSEMEKMCHLQAQKLPVYVGIEGTLSIFEIK